MRVEPFPSGRRSAILAGVLVVVGSVLPWSRTNPAWGGFFLGDYTRGTGSGLETAGIVLLPLGLLLIGWELLQSGHRWSSSVVAVTGIVTVITSFLHLALLASHDLDAHSALVGLAGVAILVTATTVLAFVGTSVESTSILLVWSAVMGVMVGVLLAGIHLLWLPYGVPAAGFYVSLAGGVAALVVGGRRLRG